MKLLPPPGPERRRQVILLGALVVVLAGYSWYRFGPGPAAPAAAPSNSRTQTPPPAPGVMPEAVRLAELDAVGESPESGRNPFGYGVKPAPPPPPYVPPPTPPPPPPPPPPQPIGPPMIPLKLVGINVLQTNGKPIATFKDPATNALFMALEGDVVDGKYKVVKIGNQSATLAYLDGTGQRTIGLGA